LKELIRSRLLWYNVQTQMDLVVVIDYI
jgi:hypothetical protein